MADREEFVNALNIVGVRSNNLIIEIRSKNISSSIIHQRNNILYLLDLAEKMATDYADNPIADIKKLCDISSMLRNLLSDITQRKSNICKEMLKDLLRLLNKAKKNYKELK